MICLERVDWVIWSFSAASKNVLLSITAIKYRIWSKVIKALLYLCMHKSIHSIMELIVPQIELIGYRKADKIESEIKCRMRKIYGCPSVPKALAK